MKARCQGNAHDFKGARVLGRRLGQVQGFGLCLALQQRHHARLDHAVFVAVQWWGHFAPRVLEGLGARNPIVVVVLNFAKPGHDVRIGVRLECADFARGGAQAFELELRLHIAQGDWQHGCAIGFGQTLHNAKGRGRKFGQRGHAGGGCLQGKAVCIAKAATGRILKAFGQSDAEGGFLGQGAGKTHAFGHRIVATRCIDDGLDAVFAVNQANALQQFDRHRRVEVERHGPNGQAGGVGVFPLAVEARFEGFAHLKVKTLFDRVGNAWTLFGARRGNPFAKHQLHFGRRRQSAVASQCHEAQG